MGDDETRLSAKLRRVALETLGRDRLAELTEAHGVEVADRRVAAAHVDALVRARRVGFEALLGALKREELQLMCDALGLDRGGREKEVLAARILALGGGNGTGEAAGAAGSAPPAFTLTSPAPEARAKREPRRHPPGAADGAAAGGAVGVAAGGVADYRHDDTRKNNPPAGLDELQPPPPRLQQSYVLGAGRQVMRGAALATLVGMIAGCGDGLDLHDLAGHYDFEWTRIDGNCRAGLAPAPEWLVVETSTWDYPSGTAGAACFGAPVGYWEPGGWRFLREEDGARDFTVIGEFGFPTCQQGWYSLSSGATRLPARYEDGAFNLGTLGLWWKEAGATEYSCDDAFALRLVGPRRGPAP